MYFHIGTLQGGGIKIIAGHNHRDFQMNIRNTII